MRFDGSDDTLVVTDSSYSGAHVVSWSPDGTRLAFNSPMTAGSYADIYTVEVSGANLKGVLKLPGASLAGMHR